MPVLLWNKKHKFFFAIPTTTRFTKALIQMRKKLLSIKGVDWKYHAVLTYDNTSLELKKAGKKIQGSDISKMMGQFRQQIVRMDLPKSEVKYFWKYEEGGQSGRPHFHVLLACPLNYPDTYDPKTKKYQCQEIGGMLGNKWGNGFVWARRIKNRNDLIRYINKDFMKTTTTLLLNGQLYGKSQNVKYGNWKKTDFVVKENDATVDECVEAIHKTKDNLKWYYDNRITLGKWLDNTREIGVDKREEQHKFEMRGDGLGTYVMNKTIEELKGRKSEKGLKKNYAVKPITKAKTIEPLKGLTNMEE